MLLIAAILVLGLAVIAGTRLASKYLLLEEPPAGLGRLGVLHGIGGAAGFALLIVALVRQGPNVQARRMGAGGFGLVSGGLIAVALAVGLAILLTHLRRRPVSNALVATHGLLAITGYTLLVTYLTMLK